MYQSEYRVILHCDGTHSNSIDRLSILLQQFAQEEDLSMRICVHQNPYLTIRAGRHIYRIRRADLRALTSDGHYCICHMTSGDARLRISFTDAAAQLQSADPDTYWPVNRGVLLNCHHIVTHTRNTFLLDDGTAYTVRRNDRMHYFARFDSFH